MAGKWRIEVDRSLCDATGMCEGASPEYFALDDEGKSRPLHEEVEGNDVVLMAAACCPTEAITVTDRESGERLAPPE